MAVVLYVVSDVFFAIICSFFQIGADGCPKVCGLDEMEERDGRNLDLVV
jgi:hypothetical protein